MMKKLKAVIIDDELNCRSALKKQVGWYCPEVEIVGEADSVESGVQLIKSIRPELIFLDIEMPDGSGLDMLVQLGQIDSFVIFTTAFDEYAIDAFKVNAIDYLLKPITESDLKNAIKKLESVNSDDIELRLSKLLEMLTDEGEVTEIIAIPVRDGLEFVNINDIVRCESEGAYCHIFLKNGKRIFISKTLRQIEMKINSKKFIRIHNSHLVNLEFITKYLKGDGGQVVMKDNSVVPVSKGRKSNLLEIL